ncbi:MAG: hypothetical protein V7754_18020 [Halioglobus sp.]
MRALIDTMPLWGVLASTIIIVWGSTELGYRSGLNRRNAVGFDNEAQVNAMTGAHLGLLAFILAFSFNMAAGHFDARKQVIIDEANAIGTAYLRTRLVEGPSAEQLRTLLRKYTDLRSSAMTEATVDVVIRESEATLDQMWQLATEYSKGDRVTVMHSLVIPSINAIYDIHQQRLYAGVRNRIPASIWLSLYVVLILSMVGMGFNSGIKGSRSPMPSAALALSFSMVLFLIADLDRPKAGLLTADQSFLQDLSEQLQQAE